MLNPPLSLLSDDLLASIVEQLANLPFEDENLKNLSLVDRVFTQSCQKYIFRGFILGGGVWCKISNQLKKKKKFLDNKPSFANRVRMVKLGISREENASVFKDPNFTDILQLFAKLPMPPHELHLGGLVIPFLIIEDPMLVVRQFAVSFFSQTLTILRVTSCVNVPLPLFLICPRLREVVLDQVGATDKSYDKYPDNQCSGREAPLLEVFKYCNSHSLVKQMITPPPRFNTPVVLWSNLRVLTLTPHNKEEVACLQPILDGACNSLEELYLTDRSMVDDSPQLPLAGLVNLSNLPNLRAFSIYVILNFKPRKRKQKVPPSMVLLHDINLVLGTIPESNRVTNLWFDFEMMGRRPFRECVDQDWVGLFNEIIRISGGKRLELELKMGVSREDLEDEPGREELFKRITEKGALLSDYPEICTHFWDPTYWSRGLRPFPRGQVRGRCRR